MSKVKWFSIPDSAELLKCSQKTIRRRLDIFLSKGCPKLNLYYKKEDGTTGKVYLSKLLLDSNFNPSTPSQDVQVSKKSPLEEEIKRLQDEKKDIVESYKKEVKYWQGQNDKLLEGQRELRILLMKEKETSLALQNLLSPSSPSAPQTKKGLDLYAILLIILVSGSLLILGLGFMMGW